MDKPRFDHDCEDCEYLGWYDPKEHHKYDLYYCPREGTVIARWGPDGQYVSGWHSLDYRLSEARTRFGMMSHSNKLPEYTDVTRPLADYVEGFKKATGSGKNDHKIATRCTCCDWLSGYRCMCPLDTPMPCSAALAAENPTWFEEWLEYAGVR